MREKGPNSGGTQARNRYLHSEQEDWKAWIGRGARDEARQGDSSKIIRALIGFHVVDNGMSLVILSRRLTWSDL